MTAGISLRGTTSKILLVAASSVLLSGGGLLHAAEQQGDPDPHARHRAMMKDKSVDEGAGVSIRLHNSSLLTQDGEPVHFVDDVMADRIVVIDFIYTTCTTVCPVLSAIFLRVQNLLGDRLGTDVHMVSVSVDPGRDTPERLRAFAANLGARPEWVWLTGDKPEIDNVLRGLGAYTPDFEDHPSMILVGDVRTGTWKRFFGFPGPDKIMTAIEELETARQVASARQ